MKEVKIRKVVTKLYLTRHGQTNLNVSGVFQDHDNSTLTELGISQALWLSERLKNIDFDAIYSSSSSRAIQTAHILRGSRSLDIRTCDALREIDVGDWKGQTHDEIKKRYPVESAHFFEAAHLYKPLSGESFVDVGNRVVPAINSIILLNTGKTILVVAHSISLKMIMSYFESRSLDRFWEPPHIGPTSLSIVEIENGNTQISLYGDTSHYR